MGGVLSILILGVGAVWGEGAVWEPPCLLSEW